MPLSLLLLVAACAAQRLDLQPPSTAMLDALRASSTFDCNPTTASVLDALGFKPSEIQGVTYDRRETSGSDGNTRIQGYNAWVTFDNQKGYLVVSVRPDCDLTTYYTRAGLKLPNIGPN